MRLGLSAPPEVELLNLWRDFRKVVEFIDRNNEWLHPMLEEIDKAKTRVRCLDQKLASIRQAFSRLKNELQVYMKEAKSFEYAANEQVKRKTNAVDKCIFSIEKYVKTIIA